jgi:SAM-dependent methyltransferase
MRGRLAGMHDESAHGAPGPGDGPEPTVEQFWEARYAGADQVWSGRVNQTLVDVVGNLPIGRALDLGCGEGGDAIWLAQHGWRVTGVDVSRTAIARGAAAAQAAGVPEGRIEWLVADLSSWAEDGRQGTYDLVTASFLHSPLEFPRTEVLRRAATLVAPGGHLMILSHGALPPWSDHHEHQFPTAAEEVESLDLPEQEWAVRVVETRSREATSRDGQRAVLDDVVVLVQRLP